MHPMNTTRLDGEVVDVAHVRRSASTITTATSINMYLGTCDHCDRPVRVDKDTDEGKTTVIKCWDCGTEITGDRLVVEYTDMVCALDCRYAFGSICRCGCSGANHARVWGMRMGSAEVTEAEALQQMEAMLRYRKIKLESLKRLQAKREEAAAKRESAFEAWLAVGDREALVADMLEANSVVLRPFQTMIENSEVLTAVQESKARAELARINAVGDASF